MQTVTVVKGPHLLWKGTNGKSFHGIRVRALGPESEIEKKGYLREWNWTLHHVRATSFCSAAGITEAEQAALIAEIEGLDGGL